MAQQVNLYDSLQLNSNASTAELRSQLQEKIDQLRARGMQDHEGPMQEASTALAILGNEMRRSAYDDRLKAPGAPSITIADLRALAATPVPDAPQSAPTTSAPTAPAAPAAPQQPSGQQQPSGFQQNPAEQPAQFMNNDFRPTGKHSTPEMGSPAGIPEPAAQPAPSAPGAPAAGAPMQPGAQQMPAASMPPAAPKVAQSIEPAADDATLKELFDRMSTVLPKVLTGLFAAQAVFGILYALSALLKSITLTSDLESEDIFSAWGNAILLAVSAPQVLALAFGGVVITALSVHFGYMVLEGKQANFFPRAAAVMIPLALGELAIAVMYFQLNAPIEAVFNLLLMTLTIATTMIAGLPETRLWFNNETMVSAQPQQMQPMSPQTQQMQPQTQQSQQQPGQQSE